MLLSMQRNRCDYRSLEPLLQAFVEALLEVYPLLVLDEPLVYDTA